MKTYKTITNRNLYVSLFIFYNLICTFLLSSQLIKLTSLGDYLQYRGKYMFYVPNLVRIKGWFLDIETEYLTIMIYSYLKFYFLPSWALGFLLFMFYIFKYIRKQKVTVMNMFINLCIFNPITLQFFYFESKEFLSLVLISLLLAVVSYFKFFLIITSIILRKENLFIILAMSKKNIFVNFFYIFVFLIIGIAIYLDYSGISRAIFVIVHGSFAQSAEFGQDVATTHRDWIVSPQKIFSIEGLKFFLLGLYTTIFSFLPSEKYFLLFFPIGIGKLFLVRYFVRVSTWKSSIFILSVLALYCIPLSVYNVGSSTRYTSVAWIVLWLLYNRKTLPPGNQYRFRLSERLSFKI